LFTLSASSSLAFIPPNVLSLIPHDVNPFPWSYLNNLSQIVASNIFPHNNNPFGFKTRLISLIIFISSSPISVAAICVSNIITISMLLSFSGILLLLTPTPSLTYLHSKLLLFF